MNVKSPEVIEQITRAFHADDATQVRALLDQHPTLKARVNDPIGPFDSPAIINVRSRAMLDVLLDAGADINAKSKWWAGGFGLLDGCPKELAAYAIERGAIVDAHAAARLGMIDRLKELVTADPTLVHARGGDGQTPLHFASTVEVAAYLLDHGADINARDIDHESTPVQWMIDVRQDIVRCLITRGCRTDILLAAALGDSELCRRILDADPDAIRLRVSDEFFPLINPKSGGTIYQWTLGWYVSAHQVAKKFGHDNVLQLLMERSPPVVKMIAACWLKDDATIQSVRAAHPDNAKDLTTADQRHLAHAARNNEIEVVRRFLDCGFPIDTTSQHQATPLHWAAFHGNLEMTRLLLRHNPPLETQDAEFHSKPMGWAIHGSENGWFSKTGDYAGTVAALLDAGAKFPEETGGTPYVQAVLQRKVSPP